MQMTQYVCRKKAAARAVPGSAAAGLRCTAEDTRTVLDDGGVGDLSQKKHSGKEKQLKTSAHMDVPKENGPVELKDSTDTRREQCV